MDIDKLTIGECKEIAGLVGCAAKSHSLVVGEKYFIRTVTYFHVGRLVAITDLDIVLADALWVADTGRFHDAMKSGKLDEIEPFANDVIISRGAIVDITAWGHSLPKEQK